MQGISGNRFYFLVYWFLFRAVIQKCFLTLCYISINVYLQLQKQQQSIKNLHNMSIIYYNMTIFLTFVFVYIFYLKLYKS